MTQKEFDEGFKLLKRFLKNEGLYYPVIKFLFSNGRPKENLFAEFNSTRWSGVDDWGELFRKTNLLCGWLYPLDGKMYNFLIKDNDLINKWRKYYYSHG